jgi:predicted TIM-barrel fold metal-dependent hydrolase
MSVLDVHAHVWPDAAAERALAHSIDDLRHYGDGKVTGLLASMDAAGIDRTVCLGVAITPDQVAKANRFLGALDRKRFIGFGSVHAGLPPADNVAALRENGLLGAKVHPLFQGYGLDDPRLHETLAMMEGHFAVIIHVGAGKDPRTNRGCTPQLLADLVERFPRLDVIACHFGGYRMLDVAEQTVIGLPVYIDTSWPPTLSDLDAARIRSVIERHGPERVLFGSDWPMASQTDELAAVRALRLSAADETAVLGGNLERLLARLASGSATAEASRSDA